VFFEDDVRVRVKKLIDAHLQHPKLARSMAHELSGREPMFADPPPCPEFAGVMYEGKLLPVQACMYLSHRARLYILKALVDYVDALNAGWITKEILNFGGVEIDITHAALYGSFRSAMKQLGARPHFRLYPRLWQNLLWSWGGFLLRSKRDFEYAALSAESGVPVDEIPYALGAFDFLFPTERGWWRNIAQGDIDIVQQMPPALCGIGSLRRSILYGKEEYADLGLPGYAGNDLAKWHNTTKRLLDSPEPELVT
jgi:hypothetical protein